VNDWADEEYAAAVLAGDVDAEASAALAAVNDPEGDPDGGGEPTLYYGSVDEFVREYLRTVYRRAINGRSRVWAARWWEYPEAVIRLEALWRAWEHLRRDPTTGMSVWWRDHADHHLPALMDPDGAFAGAQPEAEENCCRRGDPLPYEAPPIGLFPDARDQ